LSDVVRVPHAGGAVPALREHEGDLRDRRMAVAVEPLPVSASGPVGQVVNPVDEGGQAAPVVPLGLELSDLGELLADGRAADRHHLAVRVRQLDLPGRAVVERVVVGHVRLVYVPTVWPASMKSVQPTGGRVADEDEVAPVRSSPGVGGCAC
jgi:hypothetical protein